MLLELDWIGWVVAVVVAAPAIKLNSFHTPPLILDYENFPRLINVWKT